MSQELRSEKDQTEKKSILEREDVQNFLVDRNIAPEDYHLVEKLFQYSNQWAISLLHNRFSGDKEDSVRILKFDFERHSDSESGVFLKDILAFAEKYPWHICWHLANLLEKRR